MRIKFMWKTSSSGGGQCPALYDAPNGYVVQGKKLDAATRTQMRDVAADEDGVYVPRDVLDRLVEERVQERFAELAKVPA
uniref:hypothetical protein n=1 Tax=Nonomuraea sp. CA-251285 TaxID=3240002 RepID=UPI003F494904